MDKYNDFLAAQVLHENNVVSYRALSRALKVHVDVAKQMLYDFHQKQTAKKPGCVHATYLLTGRKLVRSPQGTDGLSTQEGEDSFMQSSPYMSSAPQEKEEPAPPESVLTVSMAQEENFEDAKAQFEELLSVQIYSLEPSSINDLHILVNCNQEIASKYASEDPLERWRTYGSIRNPGAKRRIPKQGGPLPDVPVTKNKGPALSKQAAAAAAKSAAASATVTRQAAGAHAPAVGDLIPTKPEVETPEPETKKPVPKHHASEIFKSFAKAKAKPRKVEEPPKEAPPEPASQDEQEDEPMEDASEGENEEQAAQKRKAAEEERKKKAEREEELRKMMDKDDDDEIMADVAEAADKAEEEMMDAPPSKPVEPESKEETVTVSNGRRRGRRRVMKKRTVKDEEGYLVTKEEAAWESFSEEEPVAKKPKPAPAPAKGKQAPKKGQGSIMNFFQKK